MADEKDYTEVLKGFGHLADTDQPKTPEDGAFQSGSLENPVDSSAAEEEAAAQGVHSTVAPRPDEGAEQTLSSVDGGVSVRYLGHGGYEAAGVEVKRNGQTVTVDEATANELGTLRDDDGNALFERV